MEKEKKLVAEMIDMMEHDIRRIGKFRKEKETLLSKARVVILSSAVIAKADGNVSAEELYQMHNHIFKRFYITKNVVRYFLEDLLGDTSISEIKKEIEENKLDKEFLGDLYGQLVDLGMVDGDYSAKEEKVMHELMEIFNFPLKEED